MYNFAISEYVTYQMVQVFMQVGDFFLVDQEQTILIS